MKKARYQVINNFQILDDDGDWSNDYQEGDILWRIIGTTKFEDEDGNLVIFRQKDIKDYLVKVGQLMVEIMTCEICGCSFVDVESEDYTEVFTTGLCCECILEEN